MPLEAQAAVDSLARFVRDAWHVLEPTTPLDDNWHIDAVCLHLQAAFEGWNRKQKDPAFEQVIQNLLINIPPGTAKSRIVAVMFPAWVWLRCPSFRWLYLSANPRVALRDSVYCRDLIRSDWYQSTFKPWWRLKDDDDAKSKYSTTAGGFRMAVGFQSRIIGERTDALVWDDPHDAEEAKSDVQRQAVLDRWDSAIGNRVNDLRSSLRIGIMQRLHEDDLSGHVLKQGGWVHVRLPMEYETKPGCECADCQRGETPIGWRDPRTEEGEVLHPTRFPPPVLDAEKRRLGAADAAGQLQQRPTPEAGLMFSRAWFQIVDALPVGVRRVRGWDKAGTEGGGDWTAGALLAEFGGIYYIADMVRGQWAMADRETAIKNTAILDGVGTPVWVEQEGGSGGKDSAAITIKSLAGFTAEAERVTGLKVTRAGPLASQAKAGNVRLLRGEWNEAFLREAEMFPNGSHDDQIDAASLAFNKLALETVPGTFTAGTDYAAPTESAFPETF